MKLDEKIGVNRWKTITKQSKLALQIRTHAKKLD